MALFIAGGFARMGWIELPPALQILASTWVLVLTGALLCIEFLADKIPGFDSVWDAVQTFIRIPAGAVLAAAALGEMAPEWTLVAALLGGTLAAGAHVTKAGSRAMINTSPEPFSNWTASFSEDLFVVGALMAAFYAPWLLFVLLAVFILLCLWLLPRLWRGLRWLFGKLKF